MQSPAANQNKRRDSIVPVMLNGARVTRSFREALFDASIQAGMTPSEFALQAAGEKLKQAGQQFSGVFHRGDSEGSGGFAA